MLTNLTPARVAQQLRITKSEAGSREASGKKRRMVQVLFSSGNPTSGAQFNQVLRLVLLDRQLRPVGAGENPEQKESATGLTLGPGESPDRVRQLHFGHGGLPTANPTPPRGEEESPQRNGEDWLLPIEFFFFEMRGRSRTEATRPPCGGGGCFSFLWLWNCPSFGGGGSLSSSLCWFGLIHVDGIAFSSLCYLKKIEEHMETERS